MAAQVESTRRGWRCPFCTYENAVPALRCEMCMSPRPGQSPTDDEDPAPHVRIYEFHTGNFLGLLRNIVSGAALGGIIAAALSAITRGAIRVGCGSGASAGVFIGATWNEVERLAGRETWTVHDTRSGETRQVPREWVADGYSRAVHREIFGLRSPEERRLARALPVHLLTSQADVDRIPDHSRSCCICFEDFAKGHSVKWMPCTHTFHSHCLDRWFQRSSQCPLCNRSL
mmetsp:Transcript_3911/g.7508  ORF Transcript_3911/g.7508 Transcript_3911/m.7508 type:complete len:230 (+) Transcript_3911:1085-1774(+)